MRRFFILITMVLLLAATTMDDEIISNLDFLQEFDLIKDAENLELQEDLENVMEDKSDEEVQDE